MKMQVNGIRRLILIICAVLLSRATSGFSQNSTSVDESSSTGIVGSGNNGNAQMNSQADAYTGAFTYKLPIQVAPARQGAQPSLVLGYSSALPSDWCGKGWLLDVGYIQRDVRSGVPINLLSVDTNGVPIPAYDDTKGFIASIGGGKHELVKVSANGVNPLVYRQQVDTSFLTFNYYTNNHWEVVDKSGKTYFYGEGIANQMENSKTNWTPGIGASTYRWALDKVVDANGNQIFYKYTTDGGKLYLTNILYNGNNNSPALAATSEVDFYLTNRFETNFSFISGYRVTQTKLLSEIDVKADGANVRKYVLNYKQSPSTYCSLLHSVTEYGADFTTALPTITFDYLVQPLQFGPDTNWGPIFSQNNTGIGWNSIRRAGADGTNPNVTDIQEDVRDMDGDGLPDRVMREDGGGNKYLAVQMNTGSGFVSGSTNYQWGNITNFSWFNDNGYLSVSRIDASGYTKLNTLDFDGDGLPDRVIFNGHSAPYTNWFIQFNSGIEGSNSYGAASVCSINAEANTSSDEWRSLASSENVDLIDMNGDMLPDRVMRSYDKPYDNFKVELNTGSGFVTNLTKWANVDGQGNTATAWNSIAQVDSSHNWFDVLQDMNGDGLPDRVMRKISGTKTNLVIQFNNGAGFEDDENWGKLDSGGQTDDKWNAPIGQIASGPDSAVVTTLADINGDGLPDRLMRGLGDPYTNWMVQINTGSGFSSTNISMAVDSQNDPHGEYWNSISYQKSGNTLVDLFDINGDGLPDRVMVKANSPYTTWVVQLNSGPFPDLLNVVSNGIGGSLNISYTASTTLDNRNTNWVSNPWTEGTKSLLPFNVWVVSKIIDNDGMGNSATNSYAFKGGYYNSTKHEFRGFSQCEATDPFGARTITYFHQSGGRDNTALGEYLDQGSISKEGMPYRVETWGTNGLLYQLVLNKVQEYTLNTNGWYFPCTIQTAVMNYEGLGSYRATAIQYSYDTNTENLISEADFGEVTNIVFNGQTFTDVGSDSLFKWITYTNIGNILNRPIDTLITSDSAGTLRLQEARNSYDSRGNSLTSGSWLNTPGTFITTVSNTYDQYGNVKTTTDASGITSTITYDSTYQQFPVSAVTSTFTSLATFDPRSGAAITSTDIKGLVSSNTFDAFFRQTASYISTNAYGPPVLWQTRTYYSLGGISGSVSQNYVHSQVNDAVDPVNGYETYIYSDGLGRTIETRAESETSGQYRVANTVYDVWGNPFFLTLPYFSPGTSYTQPSGTLLGSLTEYDSIGRAFRSTPAENGSFTSGTLTGTTATGGDSGSPVGSTTTAFVDGSNPWATVVTDANGKVRKSYRDAYGRTIQATDVASSGNVNTTYGYDLVGNLTNVTDNANNSIRMGYDSLGRKISMTDPDMGTWSYWYDNAGRMTQQTDAKTNSIVFNYSDPLGRLTSKQIYNMANTLVGTITYAYDTSDDPTHYTVYPGQLYKVTDLQGYQRFSYDVRGRTLKDARELSINSIEYVTQATYDDADRLQLLTYPGNVATIQYTYDTGQNLSQVKSTAGTGANETFYTPTSFNALGQLSGYNNGNGVATAYTYYTNSKRLQNITTAKSGTNYQNLTYTYDNAAGITGVSDGVYSGSASASVSSIAYDDLYRVTSLNSTARGVKTYGYNAIGNILTNSDFGSGLYQYGAKPHAVTSANGVNYGYDAAGNMTTRGSQTLVFDAQNQLARVTSTNGSVAFGYDDSGERLWRAGTNGYTVWIGGIYEINNGKVLCHVIAGGQLIATFEPACNAGLSKVFGEQNWYVASTRMETILSWPFVQGRGQWTVFGGTWAGILGLCLVAGRGTRLKKYELRKAFRPVCLFRQAVTVTFISAFLFGSVGNIDAATTYNPVFYYYHPDPLGSSNVLTDRSGNVVQHYEYATFGQTSYQNNTSAFPVSNRYTGQTADDETGLYYYGGRYYDPQLGRFIQPDPTIPDPTDSQSLNRYSYCRNNPLNETDPSGFDDFGGDGGDFSSSSNSSGWNSYGSYRSSSWSQLYGGVSFTGASGYSMGAGSYDLTMTSWGGNSAYSVSGTDNQYAPSYMYDGMAMGGNYVPSSFAFNKVSSSQQSASTASGTGWSWSGLATGVGLGLAGVAVGVALAPLIGVGLAAGGLIAAATYAAVGAAAFAGGVATGASVYEAASGKAWSLSGNGNTLSKEERSQAAGAAIIGLATLGFGVAKGNRPPSLTPSGAGRTGAFREALRQNGVPTSQQPSRVLKNLDLRGNPQPGRIYEYDVSAPGGGTRTVRIRDDVGGHYYGAGNTQNRGPHFNDEAGNHYDY